MNDLPLIYEQYAHSYASRKFIKLFLSGPICKLATSILYRRNFDSQPNSPIEWRVLHVRFSIIAFDTFFNRLTDDSNTKSNWTMRNYVIFSWIHETEAVELQMSIRINFIHFDWASVCGADVAISSESVFATQASDHF